MDIVNLYVDGSWDGKFAKWAFIIWDFEHVRIGQGSGKILDPKINTGRQIGGECEAVIQGIKWCEERNFKADIYYDYIGLHNWIADIFNKKPWDTKRDYTKKYRDFMLNHQKYINKMIKVKSHSGNFFNDEVDKLASE